MAEFRHGATLKKRYVLGRRLGHGGMAAVWLGQDVVLDRPVAVKVHSDAIGSDRAFVARFRREARVVARLSHPNLVRIYDYSESDERPYLVMEFVPGEDLGRRIAREAPIDRDRLADELLGAVAHIHGFGIIHRDIKPQNVIVGDDSTAKLIDFGIALPPDATALTQPGLVLATRRYAAPEVLAGAPASVRSDLYSCGVLLDSCRGPASPSLRRLISRLTNQQPDDRPSSADAALAELTTPEEGLPDTERFRPTFAETAPESPPGHERDGAPPPIRTYPRGRSNRTRLLVAGMLVVVAAALGVVIATSGGGGSPQQARVGNGGQKSKQAQDANSRPTRSERPEAAAEPTGGAAEAEAPPSEVESAATDGSVIEGNPADGVALNQRGFELIQAGEYESAVPVLEEAVASFPAGSEELDYAYALFNLGDALRRSGRPAEAIPVLERRLQIPDQTDVVERELTAAEQEAEAGGD